MRKSRTVLVTLMFITVQFIGIAYGSGGGGGGGATEWTQKMNNAELVEAIRKANEQIRNQIEQITNQVQMITNQIQMIQDMVKNTLTLPSQLYGEVMGAVNKIKGVYDKTNGIIYSMGNIEGIVKERFKSYGSLLDMGAGGASPAAFEEQYKKITETRQETVITTMKSLELMYSQYKSDADLLTQLQKKAESADGRNQILQAANQFNAFSAQELLKLRELLMMQTNMLATIAEADRTERDLEKAKMIEETRVGTQEKYGEYYLK